MNEWRSAADPPPDSSPVLAYYRTSEGVDKIVRAMRAGHHTLPLSFDADDPICRCAECDGGESDREWVEAGTWCEANEYEEVHWEIGETVLAWMPLPLPPHVGADDATREEFYCPHEYIGCGHASGGEVHPQCPGKFVGSALLAKAMCFRLRTAYAGEALPFRLTANHAWTLEAQRRPGVGCDRWSISWVPRQIPPHHGAMVLSAVRGPDGDVWRAEANVIRNWETGELDKSVQFETLEAALEAAGFKP